LDLFRKISGREDSPSGIGGGLLAGGELVPFSPGTTRSGAMPIGYAMSGRPQAIASPAIIGPVSLVDGLTKKSAAW